MNGISLINADIRCCDELLVENGHINVVWECWFDVEKYFGVKLDEDSWINFYTNWYPDGKLEPLVFIDSANGDTEIDCELTKEEEIFLKNKMNEYCKATCGMSLNEFYDFVEKEWN